MSESPPRAWKLPLVLFLGVLVGLLQNLPERTYGDDLFFVWCIVRDRVFVAHFLYMPLARAWTAAAAHFGVDPLLALRLLSAVGSAAGIALLAAAARRRGAGAVLACGLALAVLTAGSTWFFAASGELHAVQLAAFGLLAWILAGLRPASSPWRLLAAALAFGVAVGAHRSSGLLLPGVLAAYAFATPGRAAAQRLRDIGAFTLGGLASLGAMLGLQYTITGSALSEHDGTDFWSEGLAVRLRKTLGPREFVEYLGEDWVAPAFALAVLGAFAAGGLARRDRRAFWALTVALLPHAIFFPVFQYAERGAYYIVTLPVLAWAAARYASLERATEAPCTAPRTAVGVLLLAGLGAMATREELLALAPAGWLCALAVACFAAGLALPPPRVSARSLAQGSVVLAALQLVGSERELAAWDSSTPLLDWGRDTVLATGAPAPAGDRHPVLVATGFQQYMLLLLLHRPWPEPYADTWDYAVELDNLGPTPFDIGAIAPVVGDGVQRFLDQGKRVFILDAVFRHFEQEPSRGPYVRALRERFKLTPVNRGDFAAYEMKMRSDG
ncbi:MAG: hypothetical protein AAF682_07090 [Planctomycetota bacterium]